MVICFIALPATAIMSIVSVKYRPLAKEAFDCVFKKMTFRKCSTGLDVRLKSSITSSVLKTNRPLGKFLYKHFEFASWIFVFLMFASFGSTIYSGYNYYLYGNCNGPQNDGFCVFDPTGHNEKTSEVDCNSPNEQNKMDKTLSYANFDESVFPKFDNHAKSTLTYIYCHDCDYSRESKTVIDELISKHNLNVVYAHFPVKNSSNISSLYGYCIYKNNPNLFLKFNDKMFQSNKNISEFEIQDIVKQIGLDPMAISLCASSDETKNIISKQEDLIKKTGLYGTPTIFIDGNPIVGPKPLRVYERLIK